MIKEIDVFPIGHITRSRGLVGEVEMYFTDDAFDRGDAEYLVLALDNIFVPFFWEEYRFKNDNTLILKFEGIGDEEQAKKILGAKVFYPLSAMPVDDTEGELSSLRALTGYTLYNQESVALGRIVEVNDASANVLLFVEQTDGEEIILPYHDDLLIGYDLKARILQMNIPEDLLHLND